MGEQNISQQLSLWSSFLLLDEEFLEESKLFRRTLILPASPTVAAGTEGVALATSAGIGARAAVRAVLPRAVEVPQALVKRNARAAIFTAIKASFSVKATIDVVDLTLAACVHATLLTTAS